MAIKTSTGLRNGALSNASIKAQLDGGLIHLYAGAIPATADLAPTGTLLCTISVNSTGTGINFDTAASNGVLAKAPGEVWSGVNAATGTATYYRHVAPGDTANESTTAPRIQGEVGISGSDLNLSSVSLTNGATQTVDFYSVAWPTL